MVSNRHGGSTPSNGKIPRFENSNNRGRHKGKFKRRDRSNLYSWSNFAKEDTSDNGSHVKNHNRIEHGIKAIVVNSQRKDMPTTASTNIFKKLMRQETTKNEVLVADDCSSEIDPTEVHVVEERPSVQNVVRRKNDINETHHVEGDDDIIEEENDDSISIIEVYNSNPSSSRNLETIPEVVLVEEDEGEEDTKDGIECIGEVIRTKSWLTHLKAAEMNGNPSWANSIAISSSYGQIQYEQIQVPSPFDEMFSAYCREKKLFDCVRKWQVQKNIEEDAFSSTFTVCTYNVLCQTTSVGTDYLYRHLRSNPEYLSWEYRWEGLKQELVSIKADIIGLQEVENVHFSENYKKFMEDNGYHCLYKQKFGGAIARVDGCAIFWNPAVFEYVSHKDVDYFVSVQSKVLDRPNVGQILVLKCRKTQETVIVANTHLIFNETRGDIKLAQLAVLFANIYELKAKYAKENSPIIMFGDFNIQPNSLVYDFIINGCAHIHGKAVRTMSGQSNKPGGTLCIASELLDAGCNIGLNSRFITQPLEEPGTSNLEYITHPFKFDSVHSYPKGGRGENTEISTYHKDQANPDFIFYSSTNNLWDQKLQLLSRLSLPTTQQLRRMTPWPNSHVPSDHLPLIAKFRLSKSALS